MAKPDLRTVLVTRPAHQAGPLMTALKLRGYTPVAAPVLEMRATDMAIPQYDFDALAFTSANGVEAFAARDKRRDIPVFAVGPATAAAARKAQFQQIVSGEVGAEHLAGLIGSSLSRGAHVLYPSARDIAYNLDHALSVAGIRTTRVVVYDMEAVASLTPDAIAAIGAGCSAVFFSGRSLTAFAALVVKAGLSLENVKIIQFGGDLGAVSGASPTKIHHILPPFIGGDQAVIDFLEDVIARE